jgi:hypothetical protein
MATARLPKPSIVFIKKEVELSATIIQAFKLKAPPKKKRKRSLMKMYFIFKKNRDEKPQYEK